MWALFPLSVYPIVNFRGKRLTKPSVRLLQSIFTKETRSRDAKFCKECKVWCFDKKDKNITQSASWLTLGLRTDAISLGDLRNEVTIDAECSMRVLSKCRLKILWVRAYCALRPRHGFSLRANTLCQTNSSIRCTGFHAPHIGRMRHKKT